MDKAELKDKILLGLDISTSTIGVAIYKTSPTDWFNPKCGTVILVEALSLKNKDINKIKGMESLLLKKNLFKNRLIELKEMVQNVYGRSFDRVVLESPLLSAVNVNTVGTLLQFSGIIGGVVYDELGVVPDYISSYDSRYYAFPCELVSIRTFNKKNERISKKDVLNDIKKNKLSLFASFPFQADKKLIINDLISNIFPKIIFPLNKKGELCSTAFDASDALTCVMGFINKHHHGGGKLEVVDVVDGGDFVEFTTSFGGDVKFEHKISFN